MTLTDDIKREIRERVDLAHLIGGSVKLAKAGAEFKGLCPFHNETSPSFHVVPAKQMFHCFGCGKSGDCFDWVMERQHISFPDAAKMLAREVNVTLPDDPAGRFYQPRVHGRTVEPAKKTRRPSRRAKQPRSPRARRRRARAWILSATSRSPRVAASGATSRRRGA
jgi:DNA primase